MNHESKLARVVVPEAGANGPVPTRGTRVFVGEAEIKGITNIELRCDVNDVWRATITMMVKPPVDLAALAVFHRPTRWQRFKSWWRSFPPARDGGPA